MIQILFLFFLSLSLSLSPYVRAESPDGCDFPVPAFRIEEVEATGISKGAFDRVMDRIESAYAPIFAAQGCPLILHRSWSDGTVNAQAWKSGGACHVEMFGGFARYPGMTEGALTEIACHEVGHHLGGFPYYAGSSMSVEGQADYFATGSCMKKLGLSTLSASLTLSTALARLTGDRRPSRSTRDSSVVSRTYPNHPRAQCRLDTFDRGTTRAERPRCWFSP